ncbi:hypothetical protein, partial [Streptococcus pneumoniae]|uniref:hypothetical protein n=1 Tax=Streptococcus pneumoniae TaxID=1313 RepID=UPI001E4F2125
MSTTLATTVRQPSQPPRRQNTFSVTIRPMNSPDGEQHHHGAEEVDDRRHDLPRQPAIDRTGRGP